MSRSVLVTGGNRGLGLAIARELAAAGDRVAIGYRTGEPPAGLFAVRCDITDPEQVEEAFQKVAAEQGPVTALVANAGITRDKLLVRMSDADFEQVVQTNLTGTFRVVRRACTEMLAGGGGRILLISSAVGLAGAPGQANYAAAKAGLIGLARSVAREFGSRGVTCNVLAPGIIDTDMTRAISERRRAEILAQVPVRRCGQQSEVAAAARFLLSHDAGYITGAVIPIDGGWTMGH